MRRNSAGNIGVILLVVLAAFFVFVLVKKPFRKDYDQSGATSTLNPDVIPMTAGENPFGLMLPTAQISISRRIEIAKELGVVYYRPNDVQPSKLDCLECVAAKNTGFNLVLTARNGGGFGNPSTPPSDEAAYKKFISDVLDRYKPFLLVVENEQNSSLFYEGSAEDYLAELKLACSVAHSKGFKCTDGGLVSSLVVLLVADDYERSGQAAKADAYLKKALNSELYETVSRSKSTPRFKEQIQFGRTALEGYKAAGADFVNFHWYSASTDALEEAVNFLERKTGLQALTNEVGQQKSEDPKEVTATMRKIVQLNLPVAVWFSADIPIFGEAKGLVNKDGTLKPNGEAFKSFIDQNFESNK